jgi:hypothetical protein
MRIDFKAIGIALLVFLIACAPMFLSFHVPWLPYIAAFFGGLTIAYRSRFGEHSNYALLAVLISLSHGLSNFIVPSDFPALSDSTWVIGLSVPVVLFMVGAGIGAKEILKKWFPMMTNPAPALNSLRSQDARDKAA